MAVENQKLKDRLDKIEKELAQLPPRIPFFSAYDPHMTFNSDTAEFISYRGKIIPKDADSRALFKLGLNVFKELSEGIDRVTFIQAVNGYKDFIKNLAQVFKQHEANGFLKINNRIEFNGYDWGDLDDIQILSVAWCYFKSDSIDIDYNDGIFKEAFLMSALISIDDVLISKAIGTPYAEQLISASESFNNALALSSKNEHLKKARKDLAYEAALARIKKDPKQNAKLEIKNEWLRLGSGQKKYGYKAKFARDMQTKYPIIEDGKTITGWVTEWEKLPTS